MRPSKRTAILEAALRVAESNRIGLSIDTVAAEAGVTKAGVLYHFPSKHALLLAIQHHIASDWETRLCEAAGGPAETLSVRERLMAYTKVAGTIGKAELVMLVEATTDPELMAPVDEMTHRWVPSAEEAAESATLLDLYLIRLASDGMWLYESLNPMPEGLRGLASERLARLLRGLDDE